MTQEEFDAGFKLLKRFLKENRIYNKFLKITAQNKILYKKKLFISFNSIGYFKDWIHFFRYTDGIGENYDEYGEGKAMVFDKKWRKFMNEHHFDGLRYY